MRRPSIPTILALGYLFYTALTFALLQIPGAKISEELSLVDDLFMATSAVSTTGLVVASTGQDYAFSGQLFLLLGFQLGGMGYMTSERASRRRSFCCSPWGPSASALCSWRWQMGGWDGRPSFRS